MPEDRSKPIKDDTKNRMDQAVPRPDPQDQLSEEEKRALELQGEVEHATGERQEELSERAKEEIRKKG